MQISTNTAEHSENEWNDSRKTLQIIQNPILNPVLCFIIIIINGIQTKSYLSTVNDNKIFPLHLLIADNHKLKADFNFK